jgi:hypothetical protein
MSARKTREIASALTAKGFRPKENDHTYFTLYIHGRKTPVWTKISHGVTEYGDVLLAKMSRQLHLVRREFDRFVDCTKTEQEYIKHLVKIRVLSAEDVRPG